MTYVYADSTAVIGPLAGSAEPHTYDLCDAHARSLTAPRGWELVRAEEVLAAPALVADDLVAIADAVREPVPRPRARARPRRPAGQRAHLRVLPPPAS